MRCVGACQLGDPGVERSRGVLAALEGRPQARRLTCESRSAADLLAFHGLPGTEAEVFARLPRSDNPDLGFVGDPDGEPGQLPPAGYGVHAAPLAQVLRGFGLDAVAQQGRDLAWLRAETDQDRPVIVWITASCGDSVATPLVDARGRPFRAVRGEHVVLVLRVRETVLALDPATGHRVTLRAPRARRRLGAVRPCRHLRRGAAGRRGERVRTRVTRRRRLRRARRGW